MPETAITVRGEFVAYRQPERATVSISIALEGPQAGPVYGAVAASGDAALTGVKAMHDPAAGPVTWFASERIRTWAHRPWHKEGKQLPIVHHARQGIRAKFSDFDALSRWLGQVVEIRGVTVDGIEWTLTEKVREQLTRDVRARAVRDARDKAQEYADALDLGQVSVAEIADAGMLGQGIAPNAGGAPVAFARGAAGSSSTEVQLVPEDVSVSTTVDARFVVGGQSL